jgi:hypothetical protein
MPQMSTSASSWPGGQSSRDQGGRHCRHPQPANTTQPPAGSSPSSHSSTRPTATVERLHLRQQQPHHPHRPRRPDPRRLPRLRLLRLRHQDRFGSWSGGGRPQVYMVNRRNASVATRFGVAPATNAKIRRALLLDVITPPPSNSPGNRARAVVDKQGHPISLAVIGCPS